MGQGRHRQPRPDLPGLAPPDARCRRAACRVGRPARGRWPRVAAPPGRRTTAAPSLGAPPPRRSLLPLEQYNTAKAQPWPRRTGRSSSSSTTDIYHCIPWVDLPEERHRVPDAAVGASEDDRYLSVWIWIDQADDGRSRPCRRSSRASAMLSRYGVELLRRHDRLGQRRPRRNVDGFSVILSWIKPGAAGPAPRRQRDPGRSSSTAPARARRSSPGSSRRRPSSTAPVLRLRRSDGARPAPRSRSGKTRSSARSS